MNRSIVTLILMTLCLAGCWETNKNPLGLEREWECKFNLQDWARDRRNIAYDGCGLIPPQGPEDAPNTRHFYNDVIEPGNLIFDQEMRFHDVRQARDFLKYSPAISFESTGILLSTMLVVESPRVKLGGYVVASYKATISCIECDLNRAYFIGTKDTKWELNGKPCKVEEGYLVCDN